MKSTQFLNETTTAGSVASVSMPFKATQKRTSEDSTNVTTKKSKKKYANSLTEGKMKDLFVDLKLPPNGLSDEDFLKKYNKTKKEMRNLFKNKQEQIKEQKLEEEDLIIVPGQGRRLKSGFVPHGQSRVDHEVEMARSDLFQAHKNAKKIYNLIKDRDESEGLEGWVQEKIIKANDYLNTVREYLEHKTLTKEGMKGAMLGGVAGAVITKTPQGALSGANIGSEIEDMFKEEITSGGVIAGGGVGEGMAEGWKEKVGAAALAGSMALGSPAQAQSIAQSIAQGIGRGMTSAAGSSVIDKNRNAADEEFAKQIPDEKDRETYLKALKQIKHSRALSYSSPAMAGANLAREQNFKKLKHQMAEKYNILMPVKEQDVAEGSLKEIDYASELDSGSIDPNKLIKSGKVVGNIEGNDVVMLSKGNQTIYMLKVDDNATAFVGFEGENLKNIKNFTQTPGVIRALIGFLVHKKKMKIKISPTEPLTNEGLRWISRLLNDPRGLKIKDHSGNDIDFAQLNQEWQLAKKTGTPSETIITISENTHFGNKLRENEEKRKSDSLLMPFNFYSVRSKKQGVAEGLEKIYSDKKPKLVGLSFGELEKLSESAGNDFKKFDIAIKKNLNLPNWTNTLELYGVYIRKLIEQRKGKVLVENKQSKVEQELFSQLSQRSMGSIDSASVGDKVALLHLTTLNIPEHKVVARLNGFLTPKEIVSIKNLGSFQQLEFADGSRYPEKDDGDIFQQTQGWNMTKLFPLYESASKAYMLYALVGKKLSEELDFQLNVEQGVTEGSMPYPHGKPEVGDKITWYHSNHYPKIEGKVVGWKGGHLIVQSVDPSPRNTEKTVAKYRVPKNSILSVEKQDVTEGFKNTYNVGDRVDGPLGTGTIVAVSKNVNVDGRVKVKLDDPSKAGEDGKYKDSFILTTTQLKHISEQGVTEGPVDTVKKGIKHIKRVATGKDLDSRIGQEITKSHQASMTGDNKTAHKHFKRYDKLDKLANKEQGVVEDRYEIVNEIGFSSSLGDLSLSNEEIIKSSKPVGTIGSRKVFLFDTGNDKIYFFANQSKIEALVYLYTDRLMAMKNFSENRGLIYNLFQYIINIKKQKIKLLPIDNLTSNGIDWIIGQIKHPTGFKVTDLNGKPIDAASLYREWKNTHEDGKKGPTGIIISESKNSQEIRENELRLMPMDIFGSTLKKLDQVSESLIDIGNLMKFGKQGVAEGTGVTDYNLPSKGGTRKELLAKYHKTKNPKDAQAARKAGATQKELQGDKKENNSINEMSNDLAKDFADFLKSTGRKYTTGRPPERPQPIEPDLTDEIAKLPMLKQQYQDMVDQYNKRNGDSWRYADREQNLSPFEKENREMWYGPITKLWRKIQELEKAKNEQNLEEDSTNEKTFRVTYYSKKLDKNVTKKMKAENESDIWNKFMLKNIDVVSIEQLEDAK